jgi:hypothetical protein
MEKSLINNNLLAEFLFKVVGRPTLLGDLECKIEAKAVKL